VRLLGLSRIFASTLVRGLCLKVSTHFTMHLRSNHPCLWNLSCSPGTDWSHAIALGWLEYCNSNRDSYYANLRRKNGREKPYNVRLSFTEIYGLSVPSMKHQCQSQLNNEKMLRKYAVTCFRVLIRSRSNTGHWATNAGAHGKSSK
jgi:hypothetical protein